MSISAASKAGDQASQERAALYRLLQCLLMQPRGSGQFGQAERAQLRSIAKEKSLVLLAFPPKCGGTFLREVVGRSIPGAELLRGSFMGDGGQERDLYFPAMVAFFAISEAPAGVIHNHTTATNGNRELIDLFGLRPIVMLRDLQDMLCSFYDHCFVRRDFGSFGSAFADNEALFAMSVEQRKDYLVRNVAPWYVKFYASWIHASREAQGSNIQFVRFDDFRRDAAAVTEQILIHADCEVDRPRIEQAVAAAQANREQLRFNKGLSGRGAEFLDEGQRDRMRELVEPYASIDFEAFGLLPPGRVARSAAGSA